MPKQKKRSLEKRKQDKPKRRDPLMSQASGMQFVQMKLASQVDEEGKLKSSRTFLNKRRQKVELETDKEFSDESIFGEDMIEDLLDKSYLLKSGPDSRSQSNVKKSQMESPQVSRQIPDDFTANSNTSPKANNSALTPKSQHTLRLVTVNPEKYEQDYKKHNELKLAQCFNFEQINMPKNHDLLRKKLARGVVAPAATDKRPQKYRDIDTLKFS